MQRIKIRNIVRHFKYEMLSPEDKLRNLYTYEIIGFATHTETKEKLVIYKARYIDEAKGIRFDTFARPYDMFMSEVNKEKYPNIKQKYRFEVISNEDEY